MRLPLRVLVTRPVAQTEAFVQALQQQGFEPVLLPLLEIEPFLPARDVEACQRIQQTMQALANYQALIFISTNAVDYAFDWIMHEHPDYVDKLGQQIRHFAIGKATAARLAHYNVSAEQSGLAMNSESLLQHPLLQNIQGQSVLICRGLGGREHLQQALQARGAQVSYCELYRRQPKHYHAGELHQLYQQGLDFLSLNSAETIQQLLEQAIMDGIVEQLLAIPVLVPGQRLADFASTQGFQHIISAENAGLEALMDALIRARKSIQEKTIQ